MTGFQRVITQFDASAQDSGSATPSCCGGCCCCSCCAGSTVAAIIVPGLHAHGIVQGRKGAGDAPRKVPLGEQVSPLVYVVAAAAMWALMVAMLLNPVSIPLSGERSDDARFLIPLVLFTVGGLSTWLYWRVSAPQPVLKGIIVGAAWAVAVVAEFFLAGAVVDPLSDHILMNTAYVVVAASIIIVAGVVGVRLYRNAKSAYGANPPQGTGPSAPAVESGPAASSTVDPDPAEPENDHEDDDAAKS